MSDLSNSLFPYLYPSGEGERGKEKRGKVKKLFTTRINFFLSFPTIRVQSPLLMIEVSPKGRADSFPKRLVNARV
jgi:hypothetical protein